MRRGNAGDTEYNERPRDTTYTPPFLPAAEHQRTQLSRRRGGKASASGGDEPAVERSFRRVDAL